MAIGAADAPLGPDAVRAAFAKAAVSQEEQLPAVLLVEIPQVRQARRFPRSFLTKQRDDLPRQAWDRRVRETVLKTGCWRLKGFLVHMNSLLIWSSIALQPSRR